MEAIPMRAGVPEHEGGKGRRENSREHLLEPLARLLIRSSRSITTYQRKRSMREQSEVFFDSGGQPCAATLYRPAKGDRLVPCVVMGHGTSGTRDLGLVAYAERFATAGLAVLVFDYRHFGASGGTLVSLSISGTR